MAEQEKSFRTSLVKKLEKLETKRNALIDAGVSPPEIQSVQFAIPNVLIEDGNQDIDKLLETVGKMNRKSELGLNVELNQGEPVKLTDGRTSDILEIVFFVTDKTDIPKIKEYLYPEGVPEEEEDSENDGEKEKE
ncbi:MAG: hypothetical protein L0I72_09140 [Tetragenococcus halophilus]|nr:hypothetical protein [Tetragenococcus halophilus]